MSDSMLSTRPPAQAGVRGSVPSFAFDPTDPWTLTFQAGLERADLQGKRVYEVGVGTGTNVAFMLRHCAAALVLGSDLDPRLPVLAQRFVAEVAPDVADRFRPIPGSVSLLDLPAAVAGVATADVVVACLPQVPNPQDARYARFRLAQLRVQAGSEQPTADHLAHYYPWDAFDDFPFNCVGLGLIEALLRQVRSNAPQARVVLNLGCRIGKESLFRLFRVNGYRPEVLSSRIVRQSDRTEISFFVALEAAMRGTGYESVVPCEFYADPEGQRPISATTAQELLTADAATPVFHEICVLRGHPEH